MFAIKDVHTRTKRGVCGRSLFVTSAPKKSR